MKLSIITVSYNNLVGLKITYSGLSAFLKIHQDVEWIIIDGGSTDETKYFLDNHSSEIAFFVSERDNGIYNAMNKGTKYAKGEYLWFLNAGDSPSSQFLASLSLDFLGGEDLLYGDVVLDDGTQQIIHTYPDNLSIDYFIGNYLCHQAVFFKNILPKTESMYDETYKIAADLALIIKWLFVEGRSYKHLKMPVCIYNTLGVSTSKYYSTTRPEIRQAVSQALEGGENWYDSIFMYREWGDAPGWKALLFIARTKKLKLVVGEILNKVVVFYERYIAFRQRLNKW